MSDDKSAPPSGTRDQTGGESQGGAYPNPHSGKADKDKDFHGGQSGQAYHGHGQLGQKDVPDAENLNAPSKDD
ncbi:hypothetical protein IC614_02290 [Allosphingosinicella flava]|uniref:Uncharacterized protein n=1 Tax=Allosphingosinicella flava TaxID=2771430 RepID=A0A7T2GKC9_9SPHN|nr:hypothetical protein [Sphingosinicella flava]QPQ55460.1 hypothetical protein IC614_02290 [Sphingosinicella flava]